MMTTHAVAQRAVLLMYPRIGLSQLEDLSGQTRCTHKPYHQFYWLLMFFNALVKMQMLLKLMTLTRLASSFFIPASPIHARIHRPSSLS